MKPARLLDDSVYGDYPALYALGIVTQVKAVGGYVDPSYEAIFALAPSLVVAPPPCRLVPALARRIPRSLAPSLRCATRIPIRARAVPSRPQH